MHFKEKTTLAFHAITIGTAFAASYFIGAHKVYDSLLVGAFLFGACCYLIIRLSYKQGLAIDKVLFKAYRLVNLSVTVVLFIIHFYVFFEAVEIQDFIEYKSFEELSYLGIFALALWPFLLIIYLIGNTIIGITQLFLFLQLPITIALSALLVVMLGFAYRRLYQLKQNTNIHFTIPLAIFRSLTPILLCSYLLIEVAPRYMN